MAPLSWMAFKAAFARKAEWLIWRSVAVASICANTEGYRRFSSLIVPPVCHGRFSRKPSAFRLLRYISVPLDGGNEKGERKGFLLHMAYSAMKNHVENIGQEQPLGIKRMELSQ